MNTEPAELATIQFIPVEKHENFIPHFANVVYDNADSLLSVAGNILSLAYVIRDVKFTITTRNAQIKTFLHKWWQ